MVSQFVSTHQVVLLGDLDFTFPEGTHAIGRLDNHSEGLLLLTTNKKITRLLFQGTIPHRRTYLVLVKNHVSPEALSRLIHGIPIRGKGGNEYMTAPCEVVIVTEPVDLFPSVFTLRKDVPATWLNITLTEGRFHQVRKMVAAVHHRCLRLIRIAIEDICLDGLQPGDVREMDEAAFFSKLRLTDEPL